MVSSPEYSRLDRYLLGNGRLVVVGVGIGCENVVGTLKKNYNSRLHAQKNSTYPSSA